ncbi:MAG: tetratricopeptide repeat protein [Bacteroidetes bacterium]|nr:tetratricopeptide repeat protein [Bacteroidota bacterium]
MPGISLFLKKNPALAWITVLLATALFVFSPLFQNELVSWDDTVYITNNTLIQHLSAANLSFMFSHSFEGHYHPLTLLSLSLDYQFWGTDPTAYHLHNLILHLINIILIFFIVLRVDGKTWVAGITAMLFGIHPMHVEAVAWATARKDVLFSLFFLLSMFSYLTYKLKNKRICYVIALLFFILSVLSKAQAVFLPFCLVLLNFLKGEKLNDKNTWLDKIPLFLLALAFGIVAFFAQKATGYMGDPAGFQSVPETFLFSCYSFALYLFKITFPFHLSAYYPYPPLSGFLPVLALILSLLLVFFIIFLIIRTYRKCHMVFFGLMFFIINIIVFLKWIPVSNYIIADRYTYISSVGLFFIAGSGLSRLMEVKQWKIPALLLVIIVFTGYGTLSYQRVGIWKNSFTLLNDILSNHPDVYPALNSLGIEKQNAGDLQGALSDFSKAVKTRPGLSRGWANRGSLYFRMHNADLALDDFNKALSVEPGNARVLNNRGLVFEALGKLNEAAGDFEKAISNDPRFAEAISNKGMILARKGDFPQAMAQFDKALEIDPGLAKTYANRGKCKNQQAAFKSALDDLQKSLSLGFRNPDLYFELGFSCYNLKDFYKAIEYFNSCTDLSPDYLAAIIYRGFANFNMSDFSAALTDLDKAVNHGTQDALVYSMRGLSLIRLNRRAEACADFAKAQNLGLKQVNREIEKYCR